jgi:glucokinase
MTLVGLDLGGTKLAAALFAEDGEILYRTNSPLAGRRGADVARFVTEQARAMHDAAKSLHVAQPRAVGGSVPGIYRSASGTVWAPNIPEWDDYPLLAEVRVAMGADTRVVVDSDRAAYILGESWRGAAKGARNAIYLAVGTGIGAGILADGRVLRGHGDIAGAIGWLALDRPFRDDYVRCGCFEYGASGPGLVKVATQWMAEDPSYTGELRRIAPNEMTAERLFAAYDRGDMLAARVLLNAVELWGMAAANLISLFNPETIVFGGGVFGPASRLLDRILAEASKWAQPISMTQVRFVASTLGGDAGVYGAGRLAMLDE